MKTFLKNMQSLKWSDLLKTVKISLLRLWGNLLTTILGKALIYKSIKTLPIARWYEVYETGSYKALLKRDLLCSDVKLEYAWNSIMDEYIDEFGLAEETIERIELKRKIIRTIAKRITTKNRYLDNEIDRMLIDLETKSQGKSEKLSKLVTVLEKNYSIPFDENMSTYDFFRRIKSM